MNTEQLSFAQRFAVALFRSGMLSGERGGFTTPETILDAAAEVIAASGLKDQDILTWLREWQHEAALPGCEIHANAWHTPSGRDADFSVSCTNYTAPLHQEGC